jgi:hypothetical protein
VGSDLPTSGRGHDDGGPGEVGSSPALPPPLLGPDRPTSRDRGPSPSPIGWTPPDKGIPLSVKIVAAFVGVMIVGGVMESSNGSTEPLTAEEAHERIVDDPLLAGMQEAQAICWADALDERIGLTSSSTPLHRADRHFVFKSMYDCAGADAGVRDGFGSCMATHLTDRYEELSIDDVILRSQVFDTVDATTIFRDSLYCSDPALPPDAIDCMIDALEAGHSDMFTRELDADDLDVMDTVFDGCTLG